MFCITICNLGEINEYANRTYIFLLRFGKKWAIIIIFRENAPLLENVNIRLSTNFDME
jgi:hypothetical protein